MLHRYLKLLSLSCLTLFLAISGILSWHFLASQAQSPIYELGGYFWTPNYDWISLNSGNAELASYSGADYKAVVSNGNLSGWGWSKNVGWVCFGATCDPNNICDLATSTPCDPNSFGTAKPSGGWQAKVDLASHHVDGWAKILSLNDLGWVHLGMGAAVNPPTLPDKAGQYCYDCTDKCAQWTPVADPPGATTTPCITTVKSCNTCFTRTKFDFNGSINVNIPDAQVDSVAGGSGNTCFNCTSCNLVPSNDGANTRTVCDSCATPCYQYGGANDAQTGGVMGWAWNGNNDGAGQLSYDGAGWIQLNPKGGESGLVFPWLQTQYGTVFGSSKILQKTIVSGVNATYCIFAQDVFNFRSQNCFINNYPVANIADLNIQFPAKSAIDSSYKNALGKLDLTGLSTAVKTSGSGANLKKFNKYGNIIVEASNQSWSGSVDLNNKVYLLSGDLVIDGDLTVNNGMASSPRGNGLVIVNGDLRIKNNISYQTGLVSDLSALASIAWIVKGDIIIEPGVTSAVGAMIALGRDNNDGCKYVDGTSCQTNASSYQKFLNNHYGVFSSGSSEKPLVISGLLFAKAFNLERSYSNIKQGSEKIIYDGRLSANPPPGLKSLLEILPVIRDFEF